MINNIIIFFIALFFLIKGSGLFVKSASSIAKKLNIPDFIIGLTLIAIGTSLPELFSLIIASMKQQSTLIIGTIIGANIANLSLIIGIASLINPIKVRKELLKRDGYMIFFITILLILFSIDKEISRIEGFVFLLVFLGYNTFLFDSTQKIKGEYNFKEFTKYFLRFKYINSIKQGIFLRFSKDYRKKPKKNHKQIAKNFFFLALGGLLIYFGAKYLVNEAIFFADYLGASIFLIGVLISIGTTLPELSVSIFASKRRMGNITIGNSFGSCITNILLIIGVTSIISPLVITGTTIYYSMFFLLILSFIVMIIVRTDYKIKKIEGIFLLIFYIIFLLLLLYNII